MEWKAKRRTQAEITQQYNARLVETGRQKMCIHESPGLFSRRYRGRRLRSLVRAS